MNSSTNPPVNSAQPELTTRVDTAHAAERNGVAAADDDTALFAAIAGFHPGSVAMQLRGQALELATHLKDKQTLLEKRESEMNARLAVLENELRTARLKIQIGHGRFPTDLDTSDEDKPLDDITDNDPPAADAFDNVGTTEHHIASGQTSDQTGSGESDDDAHSQDLRVTASNDTREYCSEREFKAIQNQKRQLDQRERMLEQMYEKIIDLHRESLEYRLATEELWGQMCQDLPPQELAESISQLRARLAEHYQMANQNLAQRKEELHKLRRTLENQERQLRQQRREVQLWVDRRYNEIEARAAYLTTREVELDRQETELDNQSLLWNQQRDQYRRQIEELSRRLRSPVSA